MKFGEQLRSSIITEYQWYYIDYENLKKELKKPTGPVVAATEEEPAAESENGARKKKMKAKPEQKQWTGEDEERFLQALEKQLEKVYTKTQVKTSEIQRRITWEQKEVDNLVKSMNERGPTEAGPGEEEFIAREEFLSDIIADVHDLAKFVQVNYTGFYKIIKKHDVSLPPTVLGQRRDRPLTLSRK
jgi:SPX domain protein involved in polyphosphate accumulation